LKLGDEPPNHGAVTQVNVSTFQYTANAGYKAADFAKLSDRAELKKPSSLSPRVMTSAHSVRLPSRVISYVARHGFSQPRFGQGVDCRWRADHLVGAAGITEVAVKASPRRELAHEVPDCWFGLFHFAWALILQFLVILSILVKRICDCRIGREYKIDGIGQRS
jgi:hypothetical protein